MDYKNLEMKDSNEEIFLDQLNDFIHYLELIFRLENTDGQYVFLNSTKIDQDGSDFLNSIGVNCEEFYKDYNCYFSDDFLEKFPASEEIFTNIKINKLEKPKLIWEKDYYLDYEEYKYKLIPNVLKKTEDIVIENPDLNTSMIIAINNFWFEVDLVGFCKDLNLCEENFKDEVKKGQDIKSLLLNVAEDIYVDDREKTVSIKASIYDGRKSVPGIYRNGVKRKITSTGEFPYFIWDKTNDKAYHNVIYFDTNVHYSLIESFVDLLKAGKITKHKFLDYDDKKIFLRNKNGEYLLN